MLRRLRRELLTILRQAPGLTLCTLLMVPDICFCLYGRLTDSTIITGIPAWDKPLKFALSTALYTGCLAALVRHTHAWRRVVRMCDLLAGAALFLEIVIIDTQAARHTASHFNVATPLDTALWATMGGGILVLWLSSMVITAATFQSVYVTRVRTMAIRWGMVIAIVGMGSGAFMAVPSQTQKATVSVTHHLGGHTIGGADGGPGFPFLSWSTKHGDVRPAHFVGMHALQALFLLALLVERSHLTDRKRARLMTAAIFSYAALFLLILTEALLGEPLIDTSGHAVAAWCGWLAGSIILVFFAMWQEPNHHNNHRIGAHRESRSSV